jgi:hypothetical protein
MLSQSAVALLRPFLNPQVSQVLHLTDITLSSSPGMFRNTRRKAWDSWRRSAQLIPCRISTAPEE